MRLKVNWNNEREKKFSNNFYQFNYFLPLSDSVYFFETLKRKCNDFMFWPAVK